MEKLREVIEKYGRWQPIEEYIRRIEAFLENDFSISIENSKSLIESIAKHICKERNQPYSEDDSPSKLLKLAFSCIGVQSSTIGPQIATALANIGQNIGQLRNEIGAISHGRTMEELQEKKSIIDLFTRGFLIDSTEIIACFLIEYFEWKFPRVTIHIPDEIRLIYEECTQFNEFWDDTYNEFTMGAYSYPSSEILYYVDYPAYEAEYMAFMNREEGDE